MSTKRILQIAVADDHPMVLAALKNELLRIPEARVNVEAGTGEGLLAALKRHPCEVVVTDFTMPGMDSEDADGLLLIKRLKAEQPSTKIIVYTAMSNPAVIKRLYRMGVFSVINKREKLDELINACQATLSAKQVHFPTSLRGELEVSWAQGDAFAVRRDLTTSELEVVRMIVEGNSLNEICRRLSRTPSTISTHKNNAMRKLGLNTDAELIKYAYSSGML
jgi:two-component system capsular synthesis response regulator RcsB